MKNILIVLLIVIIAVLSIKYLKTEELSVVEDVVVSTSTVTTTVATATTIQPSKSSETDIYENGKYWGRIKKSSIVNGKLVLTIDFIQSFDNKKDALIASIENDYCTISSSDVYYKTKQDFLNAAKKISENEVDDFMGTTRCFPNGLVYFINASDKLRDKNVADNFVATAVFVDRRIGEEVQIKDINTLNKLLNNPQENIENSEWQLTIKNNTVTDLKQLFRP